MLLSICLIVAISDGDTLTARCGQPGQYQQVKVRVAAIDAPEKKQPWGNRSRQSLAALCHRQQAKIIQRSTDRYKRWVADVECRGRDAAAHQVSSGMAWVFDRYAKGYGALYQYQAAAKAGRRGLWADAAPVPPWEWRGLQRRKGK